MPIDLRDPSIVDPPSGATEVEMARWKQHVGVRRVMLTDIDYEDQHMLVRSKHDADARAHFAKHGFEYRGRLAFNVPYDSAPAWLINLSLIVGRWF